MALEEGAEQDAEESGGAAESVSSPEASSSKRAPSKEIRAEQIRGLEPWFNNATHRGGWRVALIYPAESLNAISGNALLKVLEEPPPNTVFLLVADAPDRLLATLLSRCRRLPLATPALGVARDWLVKEGVKQADGWLAACGGAPLLAKKLAALGNQPCPDWLTTFVKTLSQGNMPDIGALADVISKSPPVEWLDPLQRLSVDLMLAANQISCRYFPSLEQSLQALVGAKPSAALSDLGSFLNDQRRIAGHPLSAKLFAHAVLQRVATVCLQTHAKKEI
jgi:DNA polymerase-3 subunit delta'